MTHTYLWITPIHIVIAFSLLLEGYRSLLLSGSVMSRSLPPQGLQHARLPCPSPCPGVCTDSCPLSQWKHPTISSSVAPSPPSLNLSQHQGHFHVFISGGQTIGASASASVLPKSIQGCFPFRLTSLISFLSKGLSRAFPEPQFESINYSALCLLYCPALTPVHDYWKDHSLDYTHLCWQSDVFAF